jgi:hypothetical protein
MIALYMVSFFLLPSILLPIAFISPRGAMVGVILFIGIGIWLFHKLMAMGTFREVEAEELKSIVGADLPTRSAGVDSMGIGVVLIAIGIIGYNMEWFNVWFLFGFIPIGFLLIFYGIYLLGGFRSHSDNKLPGMRYRELEMPEGDYKPVLTGRQTRGALGVISHSEGKEAEGVLHCQGCGMPYVFDEDNLTCNKCGGVLGDGVEE